MEFDTPNTAVADPNYYWNLLHSDKVKRWVPGVGGATAFGFPPEMLENGGASLIDPAATVKLFP